MAAKRHSLTEDEPSHDRRGPVSESHAQQRTFLQHCT